MSPPSNQETVTWSQLTPYLSQIAVNKSEIAGHSAAIREMRKELEQSNSVVRRVVLVIAISMPSGAFGAKVLPKLPDVVAETVGTP